MTDKQIYGNTISAEIAGNVSGQVAVGTDISQTQQTIAAGQPEVTAEERARLRQLFTLLKSQVQAEAPANQQDKALERVEELEVAVTAAEPDLTTMEYVKNWFARSLPSLAGAVTSVVLHPIVGKLVEAAGDAAVAEFRRRFGNGEGL